MRHRIRQLMSRSLLAGGMLALIGAALWFWLRPTQVSVAEVYMREISPAIQGVGTVEAKVVVQLAAKIPGRIVAINVDQGDTVRRGQSLIQLENSESTAEVERAVRRKRCGEHCIAVAARPRAQGQSRQNPARK
jgi:HlyD family secretion protein